MSGLKFMAEQKFNREMTDKPERNSDPIDHSDSVHFVRGQLAAAREEVERQIKLREAEVGRLRKLISDFGIITVDTNFGPVASCIYCGGGGEVDGEIKHFTRCPAFHPDGTVK